MHTRDDLNFNRGYEVCKRSYQQESQVLPSLISFPCTPTIALSLYLSYLSLALSLFHTFSLSLFHTHSLSFSLFHIYTHTQYIYIYIISCCNGNLSMAANVMPHTLSLSFFLSLSLSLSFFLSHTHTHSLSSVFIKRPLSVLITTLFSIVFFSGYLLDDPLFSLSQWWLMTEAKRRNPGIRLYGLSWGVPAWIGNGSYFSQVMKQVICE